MNLRFIIIPVAIVPSGVRICLVRLANGMTILAYENTNAYDNCLRSASTKCLCDTTTNNIGWKLQNINRTKKNSVKQKTNERKIVKKNSWLYALYIDTIIEQFIDAILTRSKGEGERERTKNNKLFHVCLLFDPLNNHHNSMSTVFHMVRQPAAHDALGCARTYVFVTYTCY